jgi:hypothetical protein
MYAPGRSAHSTIPSRRRGGLAWLVAYALRCRLSGTGASWAQGDSTGCAIPNPQATVLLPQWVPMGPTPFSYAGRLRKLEQNFKPVKISVKKYIHTKLLQFTRAVASARPRRNLLFKDKYGGDCAVHSGTTTQRPGDPSPAKRLTRRRLRMASDRGSRGQAGPARDI